MSNYYGRRKWKDASIAIFSLIVFIFLSYINYDINKTFFCGIAFLWAYMQFEFDWLRERQGVY